MRVLITGGGGFLAAWIIQRLHRAGMHIRVLDTHTDRTRVRDIAGPEAADALEWVVADIADTSAVVNAAQGCDRILLFPLYPQYSGATTATVIDALGAQLAIFPLFDIHVALSTNLWIGAWFTGISLARSYAIRRWFNARLHRLAQQIGG